MYWDIFLKEMDVPVNNQIFWIVMMFVCLVCMILILTTIILLSRLVFSYQSSILFGNRAQWECGTNYMEYETARFKLYQDYEKQSGKTKNIKGLLQTSLGFMIAMVSALLIMNMLNNEDAIRWFSVGVLIIILILYIAFLSANRKDALFNKYDDSTKNTGPFVGLLSTLFALILIVCGTHIFKLNKENPTIPILMVFISIFIYGFLYIVNISTNKINYDFVDAYKKNTNSINNKVTQLLENQTDRIPTGPDRGKTVGEYMERMLARNIKRMHPDEEYGEPNVVIKSKNRQDKSYASLYYAYIENREGRELSELPDTEEVNTVRTELRKAMRNLRYENDSMIRPVNNFIKNIWAFLYLFIFIVLFLLYHPVYMRYPGWTKVILGLIIIALVLWIMFSLI